MAFLCRSGGMRLMRSTIFRSNPTPHPSLLRSKPPTPLISRRSICAALDCTGSLMPLHTAIASARLKSFIAADSSLWTCLSHGNFSSRKLRFGVLFSFRCFRR